MTGTLSRDAGESLVSPSVAVAGATDLSAQVGGPILPGIRGPRDLRPLSGAQLVQLAAEIREFLVASVCRTGGHLGPNLGAVELTVALHRVFDSPRDRIVWDTGHQAYVHKLLTGRQEGFDRLRQPGGLSGYPSRAESAHDLVENSHASTALGWADGLAKALELRGRTDRRVVAVVGDGSLTGGMAWEALNNLGGADRPVVVVLNDNARSYAPTVGGLAAHFAGLATGAGLGNVFAAFGLAYVGPVDGHDIPALEAALTSAAALGRPVVVHCLTDKGRGYRPAEEHRADRLHAVAPDYDTPAVAAAKPTWTGVFAEEMVSIGAGRPDVVAITAAMLQPVGLDRFAAAYPERTFDVGIAEQHAAVSAAGLAAGGLHPVVAIYATFVNRAFDQVLMDVALHRAPVTFVLDRAGVTGDDGASHNGMWDLSILQLVPGLRIAAPRDGARLRALLGEAVEVGDGPTALRFGKGGLPADLPAVRRIGGLDVLREPAGPRRAVGDVLLVAVGGMAATCLRAAELLAQRGVETTVVDPRWVKPVDPMLPVLAAGHRLVVTVEDNGRTGGVGSAIGQALRDAGVFTPLRDFGLPQRFLDHGPRDAVLAAAGLDAQSLTKEIAAVAAGIHGRAA